MISPESTLLELVISITILICMYKIYTYFLKWVEFKWGKVMKGKISFLIYLLAIILLLLGSETDRFLGFMFLGLYFGFTVLIGISTTVLKNKIRKFLMRDFVALSIEIHRMTKEGWGNSERAEKMKDTKKAIWEQLDSEARSEVAAILGTEVLNPELMIGEDNDNDS